MNHIHQKFLRLLLETVLKLKKLKFIENMPVRVYTGVAGGTGVNKDTKKILLDSVAA